MTADLPAAIEAHLKEAGFTATELLVLKKLVEQDSLTIREIAAQTGKSTGVLDQAVKKLIAKKIAQKTIINDQPRYTIPSLDTVVRWVNQDMLERRKNLERKQQDFESFIASLKMDKKRPDMEYFHGAEGIKRAYLKLLESGQGLLTRTPILYNIEDDPLRSFRVDLFRKRQVRKIFQRVIAPDTALARRFQSRDPFEYRQTVLVPELDIPTSFERTVVGDTVACINLEEESACFIRFPELAASERSAFEALWRKSLNQPLQMAITKAEPIPLKTRLLSRFREFILSRKSIAALIFFALLSGVVTFGFYKNNRELNLQRVRDEVRSIAATGALQFDGTDIAAIHDPGDITKPEYARLVAKLNLIRRSNKNIQYAYIMRPTSEFLQFTFVADADSLDPTETKDLNHDGKIDDSDALNTPGEIYDGSKFPIMQYASEQVVTDVGSDQWGTFVSGYAPIRNGAGESVAFLGIDVFAEKVEELSAESFSPVFTFVGFIILFAIIRFGAINRSLMKELFEFLCERKRFVLLVSTFSVLFCIGIWQLLSYYRYQLLVEEMGGVFSVYSSIFGYAPTEVLYLSASTLKNLSNLVKILPYLFIV